MSRKIIIPYRPQHVVARDMILPDVKAHHLRAYSPHLLHTLGVVPEADDGFPTYIKGVSAGEAPISAAPGEPDGWELIHASPARYLVLPIGRRGGKSFGVVNHIIREGTECPAKVIKEMGGNLVCWLIAPTLVQGRDIFWEKMVYFTKSLVHPKRNPKETTMEIKLLNNIWLAIKGAEHPRRLEGVPVWYFAFDEFPDIAESAWTKHLRPSATDRQVIDVGGGRGAFCGSPEGEHDHMFRYYKRGLNDPTGRWKTYRYASWQAEFSNYEELRQEITESIISDGALEEVCQERGARFVARKGRIYREFSREANVMAFDVDPGWDMFVVIDPGGSNPTAAIIGGIDYSGRIWIRYSHYAADWTIRAHGAAIWEHLSKMCPLLKARSRRPEIQLYDPAGKQECIEYADLGRNSLYLTKATKHVEAGIKRVKEVMLPPRENPAALPMLIIHPENQVCINQLINYVWKPAAKTDVDPYEAPKKKDDHFPDCVRYLAMYRPSASSRSRILQPVTIETQVQAWTEKQRKKARDAAQAKSGRRVRCIRRRRRG